MSTVRAGRGQEPVVAVAELELWIAGAASLKDRRRVVRSVVDRLRSRLSLSVVELDGAPAWQRAQLAVAVVAASETRARQVMVAARRLVEQHPDAELTAFEVRFCR